MFGYNIKDITKGFTKQILGQNQELYDQRISICKSCPLYTNDSIFHGKCDGSKCLDLKTNQVTHIPGKGRVCGCGCNLNAKLRLENVKCVLNKW